MITHVAIFYKDCLYQLPKPNRHHHIYHMIHMETGDINIDGEEGFLDDKENFLDRQSALVHAQACNQLIRPAIDNELYSENVW